LAPKIVSAFMIERNYCIWRRYFVAIQTVGFG